jgi:hypothetical protein
VHPQQGRSWLCSIRDFCEEGMLLTGGSGSRALSATGAQISPGDAVALHFSVATPTGHEHFRTQARVARLTDGGNGMGVMFEDGVEPRALTTLMDFAVASGTAAPADFEAEESEESEESEEDAADSAADASASNKSTKSTKSAKSAKSPLNASMEGGDELPDGAMRDKRISKDAARNLKSRIRTLTEQSIARLGTTYCKVSNQEFIVKARDAGTNAVQTRYFEALNQLEGNARAPSTSRIRQFD